MGGYKLIINNGIIKFATSYNEVADKLKLAQSETGDYIKLYFTRMVI